MLDRCARIFTGNMPLMRRKSGAADNKMKKFLLSAIIMAEGPEWLPAIFNCIASNGLLREWSLRRYTSIGADRNVI